MMRVIIPPGAGTGDVPLVHEGEECGFVLQGQVEIWVGDETFILIPGMPFTSQAQSHIAVEILAILTQSLLWQLHPLLFDVVFA